MATSAMAVAMAMTVAVAVLVEQDQTSDIDDEASDADVQHPVSVLDLVLVGQSLDCFHKDCEAESDEKHGVDECAEHLCSSPAIRVLV